MLALLDPAENHQIRREISDCLEGLLSDSQVLEYVANRLYFAPLPASSDLPGAIQVTVSTSPVLGDFLAELGDHQVLIRDRHEAWRGLSDGVFVDPERRERYRIAAVEVGAFRLFVKERADSALFQLLVHPSFRGDAQARSILQAWAARLRHGTTEGEFRVPEPEDYEATPTTRKDPRVSPLEAFQRAEKQKNAIKALLKEGNRDLAVRFTNQLVVEQRSTGESEHIAKSLCDLAAFAKRLGDPSLQLEFSQRAVAEAPEDTWSYGQLGDAYRGVGDFVAAMKAFDMAGRLGDARTALLGRAEVLKDVGQLDDALAALEQCDKVAQGDIVARNARAAAFAHFGRFDEALTLYNELCNMVPIDHVSVAGRAEVLRHLGRLDDALAEYDIAVDMTADDPVPHCARGEVLREMGRLDESLQWFRMTSKRFPLSVAARNGVAKVLRELGQFAEARSAYEEVVSEFPLDPIAYIGIAEVEKKRGAIHQALQAYGAFQKQFPGNRMAKNGLAAVLATLGRYDEATSLLPDTLPATRGEWIAYHIRGMIHLRAGRLPVARQILEHGLAHIPWSLERAYFRTALASLEIRVANRDRASALLEEPSVAAVEPIAAIIRMHASALGPRPKDTPQRATTEPRNLLADTLRNRLVAHFALPPSKQREEALQLFEYECDVLLLAA
jgi:tetratricopeptide (TPR) repeat protein